MNIQCEKLSRKKKIYIELFSLVFSFINVHVIFVENFENIKYIFFVECFSVLLLYIMSRFLFYYLFGCFGNVDKLVFEKSEKPLYYWGVALAHILNWGGYWLTYWPGLFSEDVADQLWAGYTEPLTTHHPLIHDFYLQFFYYYVGGQVVKNYNVAMAISIVVQMVCFSLSLAYLHTLLYRAGLHYIFRYLLIASTCFLPMFPMLVICTTKDVFFSTFVVLFVTLLSEYILDKESFCRKKWKGLLYVIAIIGLILFRKNGIYPIFLTLIAIVLVNQKSNQLKKKCIYTKTLIGVLLGIAFLNGIKIFSGAQSGSINEMLSVPYQQIACVYIHHKNDLSQKEIEAINEILPDVERYNPYLADPIKARASVDSKSTLLKLWGKLGVKYSNDYLKAFLKLNAGYFSIYDVSYSEIYGTGKNMGLFLTYFVDGFGVEHKAFFPSIEILLEKLYSENDYLYVPVLRLLCSPALYLWIILMMLLFTLLNSRYDLLPPYIFVTAYILTLFLGPCALIRYALPYISCIPLCVLLALYSRK